MGWLGARAGRACSVPRGPPPGPCWPLSSSRTGASAAAGASRLGRSTRSGRGRPTTSASGPYRSCCSPGSRRGARPSSRAGGSAAARASLRTASCRARSSPGASPSAVIRGDRQDRVREQRQVAVGCAARHRRKRSRCRRWPRARPHQVEVAEAAASSWSASCSTPAQRRPTRRRRRSRRSTARGGSRGCADRSSAATAAAVFRARGPPPARARAPTARASFHGITRKRSKPCAKPVRRTMGVAGDPDRLVAGGPEGLGNRREPGVEHLLVVGLAVADRSLDDAVRAWRQAREERSHRGRRPGGRRVGGVEHDRRPGQFLGTVAAAIVERTAAARRVSIVMNTTSGSARFGAGAVAGGAARVPGPPDGQSPATPRRTRSRSPPCAGGGWWIRLSCYEA